MLSNILSLPNIIGKIHMKKTLETKAKPNLADLLLIFRRNILESLRKEGFKNDLTFCQVEVLRFVSPYGKKTMKEIADYLKITPPSVTEIICEMEYHGLVLRKGSPDDRRVVFIELSRSAKKLYVSLSKRKDLVLKKMIGKLSKADHDNLERIIRILVAK